MIPAGATHRAERTHARGDAREGGWTGRFYACRIVLVAFWMLWGWMCAALGSLMFVPQVVRLLRSHNPAGLSLLMWQLNTAAAVGWTLHGAHWGSWNVALPNAIIAVCAALVVHMIQTLSLIHISEPTRPY